MAGIDESVLAEIAEMVGDDNSMILELVGIYLGQLDVLSTGIASAQVAGDCKALAFHAHSLKSSSANLGATALAAQCSVFEQKAREGKLPTPSEVYVFELEIQTVRGWFGLWREAKRVA